jgi:hypothetical protein
LPHCFVPFFSLKYLWVAHMNMSSMSDYTKIIFPCKPRLGQYKISSPATLKPPSSSYSPLLSLGTGISDHCLDWIGNNQFWHFGCGKNLTGAHFGTTRWNPSISVYCVCYWMMLLLYNAVSPCCWC